MVPKISRKSTLMLKGHDLNLPDNTDTYWGYVLGRQGDRDPWRIIDQGVG